MPKGGQVGNHDRAVARYRFGDFVLSPRRRMLIRAGREQALIPRYFDLLVFLIEHRHEARLGNTAYTKFIQALRLITAIQAPDSDDDD